MSFLKSIWKNGSKHKKLPEELALKKSKEAEGQKPDTPESDKDVVSFKLKYLGSTVVEKVFGENISKEAVKNIIKVAKVAKASGKKLQRVNVSISLKGIAVTDIKGNDMFEVSIYRISNCSTDSGHRQVFSLISTDSTDTTECHAFWCAKRKMAEMVALTVAHAFSTAYEAWRLLPSVSKFGKEETVDTENMKNNMNIIKSNIMDDLIIENNTNEHDDIFEEKLIDFDDEPVTGNGINIMFSRSDDSNNHTQWVCFEDDFDSLSSRWNSNKIDAFFS